MSQSELFLLHPHTSMTDHQRESLQANSSPLMAFVWEAVKPARRNYLE